MHAPRRDRPSTERSAFVRRALAGGDAAAAASQEDERFRRLFSSGIDAMVIVDDAGRFCDANDAACEVLGWEREALLGRGVADVALAGGSSAAEWLAAHRGGEPSGEVELVRPDGGQRVLELDTTAIDDGMHLVILRDVTQRRRAERRSRVLLEIAQGIGGSLERTEIVQRVQRRLAAALPCDAVVAWYWDPESEVYRLISHVGIPDELVPTAEAVVFRANEPFGGRLERETVVLNDMAAQSWLPPEMWRRFGIEALVSASFRARGRLIGSLGAIRRTPGRPFSAEEAELCTAVAAALSVAIEAAELYRTQLESTELAAMRARFSQELIEALHSGSLLERMCRISAELLGAEASHFLALRPEREDFVALASYGTTIEERQRAAALEIPAGEMGGLLAALAKDDVVQLAGAPPGLDPDPLRHPLGLTIQLCIALRRGSQVVGVLAVHRRGRTAPFTERQKTLARSIAHMASVALEHARVVEELARSNDMKSELVGVFSHEVRTPLNVIVGYHDLLLDGAFGPLSGEQRDAVRRAQSSALGLAQLIQNSLDLNRLDDGRMTVDLRETSVPLVIGALDAETALLRETSGVPLRLELEPGLAPIRTDPGKLHAALSNVLVNAFQHTAAGSVRVVARPRDGGVEIAVVDTGTGIPAAALDELFQPFARGNGSASCGHRGVGLGLHVAERMLATVGGTISATSVVGRGSCFRIWVPDLRREDGDDEPVVMRVARRPAAQPCP